jgi:hypothetical protein
MKPNTTNILLFALIVVLVLGQFSLEHFVWKKSHEKLNEINDRITLLETAFLDKPDKVDSLAIQKLALEIKQLEFKIQEYDNNLRNDFFWIVRFGVPATLIGLILLFWSVFKTSLSFALAEAKKEREKRFKSEERLLRELKQILVIHHSKVSASERMSIQEHFDATRFENVHYIELPSKTLEKKDFTAYHLIMFHSASSKDGKFSEQEMKKFIQKHEIGRKTVFFSYDGGFLNDLKSDERFSSANFKSQIAPNILNLLKFQEISMNG